MGAHAYIKPRLDTAMRELAPQAGAQPRPIRYVGRSASASVGEHAKPVFWHYIRDLFRHLRGALISADHEIELDARNVVASGSAGLYREC